MQNKLATLFKLYLITEGFFPLNRRMCLTLTSKGSKSTRTNNMLQKKAVFLNNTLVLLTKMQAQHQ